MKSIYVKSKNSVLMKAKLRKMIKPWREGASRERERKKKHKMVYSHSQLYDQSIITLYNFVYKCTKRVKKTLRKTYDRANYIYIVCIAWTPRKEKTHIIWILKNVTIK